MKKTKIRILILLLFLGGLIILPQKAKAAEIIPVNISVKYGQTEAREIVDMINEARTNSEYAWYWNMDDTTKTYCTDLKELKYDYDLERVAMKRAAEIALSYTHERPAGGYAWETYPQENIKCNYGDHQKRYATGSGLQEFAGYFCACLHSLFHRSGDDRSGWSGTLFPGSF